MASDAATGDLKIKSNPADAETVESKPKNFLSPWSQFYGMGGNVHPRPYAPHNLYCAVHRKLLSDMGKMQMYDNIRRAQFTGYFFGSQALHQQPDNTLFLSGQLLQHNFS